MVCSFPAMEVSIVGISVALLSIASSNRSGVVEAVRYGAKKRKLESERAALNDMEQSTMR